VRFVNDVAEGVEVAVNPQVAIRIDHIPHAA
jgi:hypothetical protein